MMVKYYGIRKKEQGEELLYSYAKNSTKLKSLLPGIHRKYYKRCYANIFSKGDTRFGRDNSIPSGHFLNLEQIVTADLICRDDITNLQKGIRRLLKRHRAGDRFWTLPIESTEEICSRINSMDSTLLSWYDGFRCGIFDFRGEKLENAIDYYSVSIKNLNASYLCVEFSIVLTEAKQKELQEMIRSDYHDRRGYAKSTLVSPKNGGAFEAYNVCNYDDAALKSDKIYEWISCLEWEFYEALKKYFPFLLHQQGIIPPRIEVFLTDIDYRDKHDSFWSSVGVRSYDGQFIDERHKMFFSCSLSGRYDRVESIGRLIYIAKDDGIEIGQFKSIKDYVYHHVKDYAREYFRFMFLEALSNRSAKVVVKYKQELDKIKLRKNKLKRLLKLRYKFEREIDYFIRYVSNNDWERSLEILHRDIYRNSDEKMKGFTRPFYTSYKSWGEKAVSNASKLKQRIDTLQSEFDSKGLVLQHLANYKNTSKTMILNVIMLVLAAATLFFVVFPECAIWLANLIKSLIYPAKQFIINRTSAYSTQQLF